MVDKPCFDVVTLPPPFAATIDTKYQYYCLFPRHRRRWPFDMHIN